MDRVGELISELQGARSFDERDAAFTDLLAKLRPIIHRFTSDPDTQQDATVLLWEMAQRHDPAKPFAPLYKSALHRRLRVDRLRQQYGRGNNSRHNEQRRTLNMVLSHDVPDSDGEDMAVGRAYDRTPLDELIAAEEAASQLRAVHALCYDETDHQIVGLLAEGCTIPEMAERLGVQTWTINNRLSRLRKRAKKNKKGNSK